MTPKISICIPIALKNRREITDALVNKYDTNYLFIGRMFQETITKERCEIDIYPREVSLTETFKLAGDKLSPTPIKRAFRR